ncbi:type II toxin-antitoxin system Phd/YefM family antitoxin [Aeromicrobium alkaliterrae]
MSVHAMSEARANLAALLDAVERGEEVVITRHGRPAARLVAAAAAHERPADLMLAAGRLVVELDQARSDLVPDPVVADGPSADELVEALRRDRAAW